MVLFGDDLCHFEITLCLNSTDILYFNGFVTNFVVNSDEVITKNAYVDGVRQTDLFKESNVGIYSCNDSISKVCHPVYCAPPFLFSIDYE
jgi:hypothetical protein